MKNEIKITNEEVSLTRRALIKAGWAVPVVLSIGLSAGDIFAKASPSAGAWGRSNAESKSKGKYKGYKGQD